MTPEQKKILKEHIIGLVQLFNKEGVDIKPYPKVVFKESNDPNDITSPTGHYSSADNTLVLYCNGRAPKDVLNTTSHELWHKHQDVKGKLDKSKLGNTTTNYTNGTDYLKEIEEDAYVNGNIMRRKYTESLS